MPTPSADPIRLQIIDRFVTVLSAITAGASYWYTPGKVSKGFLLVPDIPAFPCYMVMAGEKGGQIVPEGMPDEHTETFTVSVKGVVQCNSSAEAMTTIERALRDVRKAINDDSVSGSAGTLGVLAESVWIVEGPDMDDGYLIQNYGFFDQRFQVKIIGLFGEL